MTITNGGTVDLEGANDVVQGGIIGAETFIIGTLQEKLQAAGKDITLTACEPVRDGTNSFIARLSAAPTGGATLLLAYMVCEL